MIIDQPSSRVVIGVGSPQRSPNSVHLFKEWPLKDMDHMDIDYNFRALSPLLCQTLEQKSSSNLCPQMIIYGRLTLTDTKTRYF